ncbi:hypothetical protein Sf17_gp130 [Shigella phage Sf17]|nr:hypothetical protein FDJ00_gp032 [Shigella phage Sf17]AUV63002.1 hypothetical protein Sf17_gp130 [Shigella phage Sf17]
MPDNTAKTYSYIVNRFTAYGSKYGYNVKTQKVTLFTSIEELPTVAVKLIFTKKTK